MQKSKSVPVVALALGILVTSDSLAQKKADGKWYFPDSVAAICVNIEQSLVSSYQLMVENNRALTDENSKLDKRSLLQYSEAYKKSIIESEESWSRLGCASILYSGDRSLKKRIIQGEKLN